MVVSTAPATGSLDRLAASLAAALAERLLFCGLAGILSSSRYITGTRLIAIGVPFRSSILFIDLQIYASANRFNSRSPRTLDFKKQ
jgi:hypothetical protein